MNSEVSANWYQKYFFKPFEHPFFWIALFILLVYGATFFYDIVFLDDDILVRDQFQYNKNWSNVFRAFSEDIFRTPHQAGSYYRPIERLTFMLDAQFGQSAVVFMSHFTNVILHIAAIYLFFSLLINLKIKKEVALLFSLIFAVHPLAAQTVSFIPGRNDSLLAIFIFPAFIFFLKYLESRKGKYFFWHLFFLALSLFTKETAVVLPLIYTAYILIFINLRVLKTDLKPYLYLAAGWSGIIFFWFLIRQAVIGNMLSNNSFHIFSSFFNNFFAFLVAIGKIILPLKLSVFPILKDTALIYGIAVLVILSLWFVSGKDKNYRMIIFGCSWFILFLAPALLIPNTQPGFSENRIYLPMFGFTFVALGLGKINLIKIFSPKVQKIASYAVFLILIITFSTITIYRNKYYKDKFNFWNNVVETNPNSAFGYNNLGMMHFQDGSYENAEKEFKKALDLNFQEPKAHHNLALVYYVYLKDYDLAEQEFKKEIAISPSYSGVYYNLGLMYFDAGNLESAEESWIKTLEVSPNHAGALRKLMDLKYQEKKYDEADFYANQLRKAGISIPYRLAN